MPDERSTELAAETVELLRTLIRNECVNDGTERSGSESRNADVLQSLVERRGVDIERWEPAPGRASFVAKLAGTDPDAPSLCLMGHTDVVPVDPSGWQRDPFAADLVTNADGVDEVWGRGAVDMLNMTASMAVAFRDLVGTGFRPRGDLVFFAVADEEAGSAYGARWVAEHHVDAIRVDNVLTENGGLHDGGDDAPVVSVTVAEKGVAWRRLRVSGTPGHGSMPFRIDLYSTAVGKKYVMAITGLIGVGFVVTHMIGNLKMYLGLVNHNGERVYDLDVYGEFLRELLVPILPRTYVLWGLRLVLIGAIALHLHAAYTLTLINRRARPAKFAAT